MLLHMLLQRKLQHDCMLPQTLEKYCYVTFIQ